MPKTCRIAATAALAALLLAAPASAFNVNKSINIDPGTQSGSQTTVSGSITVGNAATVTGSLDTVNGKIRVDENARIRDAETVNGSVRIGPGASTGNLATVNGSISIGEGTGVDGSVGTVNGSISLETGTTVSGDVGNVNGRIGVSGAKIGGDLTTVAGDVSLDADAVVRGDLVVEKSKGNNWFQSVPQIVIGPGVRVEGDIVLEREVELYISETAEFGEIRGVMSLDDAVRFSGDRP